MTWKDRLLRLLEPVAGDGVARARRERLKGLLREGVRQYVRTDLRWSYLAIAVMVVIGAGINLALPHGWTVWPVVLAAGMMMLIHEAADRNLQSVPPFHAYTFFISAMTVWLAAVVILSAVNPLILLAGFGTLIYYCTLGYIRRREREKRIAARRAAGQCIHCGHPADYDLALCLHCGREADPEDARLKRVIGAPRSAADRKRTRDALTPAPPTASAARKERELLGRRRERQTRRH